MSWSSRNPSTAHKSLPTFHPKLKQPKKGNHKCKCTYTASSDSDVPDTTHAFMLFHESTCLQLFLSPCVPLPWSQMKKYERLTVTWNIRTLGMSESIAGAPQMICCLTFGATDDLRAANKTPFIVTAQSQMQSLMEMQRLQFYTWLPQRFAQHQTNYETNKLHLTLHGSHMVDNLEGELDFTLPQNKQLCPFRKQDTLVNNNQQD